MPSLGPLPVCWFGLHLLESLLNTVNNTAIISFCELRVDLKAFAVPNYTYQRFSVYIVRSHQAAFWKHCIALETKAFHWADNSLLGMLAVMRILASRFKQSFFFTQRGRRRQANKAKKPPSLVFRLFPCLNSPSVQFTYVSNDQFHQVQIRSNSWDSKINNFIQAASYSAVFHLCVSSIGFDNTLQMELGRKNQCKIWDKHFMNG